MNRRNFLRAVTSGAAAASLNVSCSTSPRQQQSAVKPIEGSWLSIWWDDRRHFHWNDACVNFSAAQWEASVKEVAELGMEYLVLLAIAKENKAFYDSRVLPKLPMACDDPIGALLSAGDKYRVKFFISSDWYGAWDESALVDPARVRKRFDMMEEVASRYAGHKSFYGWYWPNEAHLSPYFTPRFMTYVNSSTAHARTLTPRAKTLTAPYGTYRCVCDDTFVRQLEEIDVDIIAYQDEVGCLRMGPAQSAAAFERLRRAHDKVPQRALWADVETFAWEGEPNRQQSPLIPAPFTRVREQLEAVSPFADRILIYQYQGLMNKPDSKARAGHPEATRLYSDYVAWLKEHHPRRVKSLRS